MEKGFGKIESAPSIGSPKTKEINVPKIENLLSLQDEIEEINTILSIQTKKFLENNDIKDKQKINQLRDFFEFMTKVNDALSSLTIPKTQEELFKKEFLNLQHVIFDKFLPVFD